MSENKVNEQTKKYHSELADFAEWLDRHGYLYPSTPQKVLEEYWGSTCDCDK